MRPNVSISLQTAAIAAAIAIAVPILAQPAPNWAAAFNQAAITAPDARIIVLGVHDGNILASRHLDDAARTLAAPGSTLKPLLLYKLLESSRWDPARRIACRRTLTIAGRRLACSHPVSDPFDAREALAWSCNTYFAEVARSLPASGLSGILRSTGLLDVTGLTPNEAVAEFREPRSVEETQLTWLGIENIRITPLELAAAYRRLANEIAEHGATVAASTIQAGLADSTEFGIAQSAKQNAVSVAGKTGTAESTGSHQTHGWFAGFAPAHKPRVVIVVYLPVGRGADAARLAGIILAHAPAEARSQ
jgi:cell division protein FtsI/penicillin-binding protein 2